MLLFVIWYLVISILGWITFPIAYRLFPGLADRGYSFSRIFGLLLWGYFFWLLASFGVLSNQFSSILFSLFLLTAISVLTLSKWTDGSSEARAIKSALTELFAWLKNHRFNIILVEIIFFVAFAGYTLVRAANPEILGTEKPMEVAFINAILKSPTFPPNDPWLSGYSISYYYFGYILVAMLAKFTSTPGAIAFNLGLGLIFGLAALGAYGLVFNLLRSTHSSHNLPAWPGASDQKNGRWDAITALLGPVFILLLSNIEGLLEILHARGIFPVSFWVWLDIQDINQPPTAPFNWLPRLFGSGNWWWWRASRVLQDFDLANNSKEIIDEFPVFSFVLGDLHPHVLVIPFAFLAMALALNHLLSPVHTLWFRMRIKYQVQAWLSIFIALLGVIFLWFGLGSLRMTVILLGLGCLLFSGFVFINIPSTIRRKRITLFFGAQRDSWDLEIPLYIRPIDLLVVSIAIGSLAFLNVWDFPFYLLLFAGIYTLKRIWSQDVTSGLTIFRDFIVISICVGILGVVLYFLQYLGFSSQAGGVIPNLIYPTRGAHLWVMFLTLLIPLACYLVYIWSSYGSRQQLKTGISITGITFVILLLFAALFGLLIMVVPGLRELFLGSLGADSPVSVFTIGLTKRALNAGGWVTLLIFLALIIGMLWPKKRAEDGVYILPATLSRSHIYSFGLLLVGGILIVSPEFFFLRDQFGWRMNTIFKFYYQGWLMWGVIAAFGTGILLKYLDGGWGVVFRVVLGLVLFAGLTYTVLGFWDRTRGFSPDVGLTLDGSDYIGQHSPDELAAIRWIASAPLGIVAEAVGGSYTNYARVSAFSGQPTVLGWPGHESQWRGGGTEMGSRQSDIELLYCARDWLEAESIIAQYDIRYVYVGDLERSTYTRDTCGTGLMEEKFGLNLAEAYRQGDVVIYEVLQ
jgi:uncharacterized membrane protein